MQASQSATAPNTAALPSSTENGAPLEGNSQQPNCLDGLWSVLQYAQELMGDRPEVVAELMQTLLALWQVGQSGHVLVCAAATQFAALHQGCGVC